MQLRVTMLLPVLLAVTAIPARADEAPPAGSVTLRSITWAGRGCPTGDGVMTPSPDAQALILSFQHFTARVGPDVPFSERRVTCQINIGLEKPRGWSYAIDSFTHKLNVELDSGVKATITAVTYAAGASQTPRVEKVYFGPVVARDVELALPIAPDQRIWSRCNSNDSINLSHALLLDNHFNTQGRGKVGKTTTGGAELGIHLAWRRCP